MLLAKQVQNKANMSKAWWCLKSIPAFKLLFSSTCSHMFQNWFCLEIIINKTNDLLEAFSLVTQTTPPNLHFHLPKNKATWNKCLLQTCNLLYSPDLQFSSKQWLIYHLNLKLAHFLPLKESKQPTCLYIHSNLDHCFLAGLETTEK